MKINGHNRSKDCWVACTGCRTKTWRRIATTSWVCPDHRDRSIHVGYDLYDPDCFSFFQVNRSWALFRSGVWRCLRKSKYIKAEDLRFTTLALAIFFKEHGNVFVVLHWPFQPSAFAKSIASNRWIRSLSTVHKLISNERKHQLEKKFDLGFKPGAAGWETQSLPLCYAAP